MKVKKKPRKLPPITNLGNQGCPDMNNLWRSSKGNIYSLQICTCMFFLPFLIFLSMQLFIFVKLLFGTSIVSCEISKVQLQFKFVFCCCCFSIIYLHIKSRSSVFLISLQGKIAKQEKTKTCNKVSAALGAPDESSIEEG